MTPERWQQIDDLLQAALAQPAAARQTFLQAACAGDAKLLREVASLLEFQPAREDGFLAAPPAAVAAELLEKGTAELLLGRTLGRYELQSTLGRGGMGTVYLAQDTQLGRQVALKLLPRRFTSDAERVRRFRQEARAISALNHPNILTIHEIGTATVAGQEVHFLATEYVAGQTLRARLTGAGLTGAGLTGAELTLGAALDSAAQVAQALAAAHEAGIIHRDIKPENIMVRPDGLVKVLDFGLAKLTGAQTVAAKPATFSTLHTSPGYLLGTISYMSPEQARGLEVDARSDIFSLGVVLYEMLTGRAPFAGATTGDVLVSIVEREPPPLAHLIPAVPAALQRIVSRALAKDCAARYQQARELQHDLRELKQELELAARLKQPKGRPVGAVSLSLRVGQQPERDAVATLTTQAGGQAGGQPTGQARRRFFRLDKPLGKPLALALAVFVLGWAGLRWGWPWWTGRSQVIDSIAVLPFANADNDPQMEYLPDGLAESLRDSLAQLPALRVSARNTVIGYKGREIDPRQAGRELQVRALITGRVARQGEGLIIRVALVDTANGARLWSEEFQRSHANLVTLQAEMAREVAAKLQRRLSPNSQQQLAKRHSTDSQAYELYAQGRYLYLRYARKSQEKALDYFRQAIALDPRYALAYCGIADVYADLSSQHLPPSEAIPKARDAALKAIELDETLPEAHHSLALVKLWGDWDWPSAEREYKRALELNPNLVLTRIYYAELLSHQQRFEESLREIKRAEAGDPASLQALGREANIYFLMREYERSIALYRKILELNPANASAERQIALALSQQGKHQEAVALVSKLHTPAPPAEQLTLFAYLAARAGQRDEALKLLRELHQKAAQERVSPVNFAYAYVGLGEPEQAFDWLRKGYEERSDHLLKIGADPVFDPLRADPRYAELVRGLGLQP